MGKLEDLLKEVILDKYKSIREFTQEIGMPYSTVDTILKRGIRKSNVDNLIRICEDLEISADALVQGYIEKLKPITTIAAHHDEEEWTEEELNEIEEFKKFVLSKRNNPKE